jgi:hypothetical protein
LKKYLIIFITIGIAVTAYSARDFFGRDHHALTSKENQLRWLKAKPAYNQLRSGDLIFRHGRGFISNSFMSLGQKERKYSHAGIISVEGENVFVYHALGGEENITNRLRKDPLEVFCKPSDVHSFGIYRTDLSPGQLKTVLALSSGYFLEGLEFDTKFDLATDDKMYCTEFIYKVFSRALGEQNYISLSAFSGKEYIACDDLYLNTHSKPVYTFQY